MNTVIDEKIKQKMDELRKLLPTERSLVIPLLHEVQNKEGWVSVPSMKEIANYLQIPVGQVQEVATFYTMFNLEKKGTHHIEICTNIACYLNGAEKVMRCAERRLGIKPGETTRDGKFTLSEVECLAACGTGPVGTVHHEYIENLTEEKILSLIDKLENEGGH